MPSRSRRPPKRRLVTPERDAYELRRGYFCLLGEDEDYCRAVREVLVLGGELLDYGRSIRVALTLKNFVKTYITAPVTHGLDATSVLSNDSYRGSSA